MVAAAEVAAAFWLVAGHASRNREAWGTRETIAASLTWPS